MSAWIVTEEHIRVLVQAGLDYRYDLYWTADLINGPVGIEAQPSGALRRLDHTSADLAGQILWRENYRSVNYRYDEDEAVPAYVHRKPRMGFAPVEIIKAIHCLDYQSCEHPDWLESEAHHFLEALEASLISRLPGYDEAPWGIDENTVPGANSMARLRR